MRAPAFTLALIAALLSAPVAADAGVVILKSGKVLFGKIDGDDVTEETIVLQAFKRGDDMKIPRSMVRWFSIEHDKIPDAYWEKYADKKIDKAFQPELEKWRLRKKHELEDIPMPEPDRELLATQTVELRAPDGVQITGDLYGGSDKTRPIILLCHQARSSRGEYKAIAPRLVKKGYACLAIDQRSGHTMNGVDNLTAKRAASADKPMAYPDARQDIEAAIAWLRKEGYTGKLTLWGSSYSASLALMIGASSDEVSAVIAFSPGDYLRPKGAVAKEAKGLTKPLLVVAPEKERGQVTALADVIPSKQKTLLINESLLHGSSTLFKLKPPQTKPTWDAVYAFLEAHCR